MRVQVRSIARLSASMTALTFGSEATWWHDHLLLKELSVTHRVSLERLRLVESTVHKPEKLRLSVPEFADVVLNFDWCDKLLRASLFVLFLA